MSTSKKAKDIYTGMYSEEEYRLLGDMITGEFSFIRSKIEEFLKKKYIYTKKYSKPYVYRSLSLYFSSINWELFEHLYLTPFDSLPLFLNSISPKNKFVISWRLIICK